MVKTRQPKTLFGEIVLTLYVIGYILISILPMVKYSVSYVVSGLYGLLFIVYYYFRENNNEKFLITVLILVLLGVLQGAIAYLNENAVITEIINEPIRVLRIIVPCFIFYSISNTSKTAKVILWLFITGLFIYIAERTLISLATDNMIARKLASGSQDEVLTEYRMQNIGGFGFSYALGFMFPLFVILIFNSKSVILKIFSIIFVVYIFYFTTETQYMILFVILVISIFLIMMFASIKPQTKIIGIIAFLVFLLVASTLFRWMATLDVGKLLRNRLTSIADFFDGEVDIEETTVRVDLLKEAFVAFLKNPFTGQMNSAAASRSHSLVLGTMASIGILGLVFIVAEFIIYYKISKKVLIENKIDTNSFNICFICYVILAVLNPIGYSYEIAVILFFYIPLTINLFYKRNKSLIKRLFNGKGDINE